LISPDQTNPSRLIPPAVKAVSGAPEVVADRTTFYGMREIGVLDPGGNVVLFAQRVA
jgi:hypothetical protein